MAVFPLTRADTVFRVTFKFLAAWVIVSLRGSNQSSANISPGCGGLNIRIKYLASDNQDNRPHKHHPL